jgi:hypothetical protein
MPNSSIRLVSLRDPNARPIAKGRIGKPVEFGYKAQIVDNEDGIVLDYDLREGNPADAGQALFGQLGLAWTEAGYVFVTAEGRPYHPNYFTKRLQYLSVIQNGTSR